MLGRPGARRLECGAAQERDAALEREALLILVPRRATERVTTLRVGEQLGYRTRERRGRRSIGEQRDAAVHPGLARRDAAVGDDRLAKRHAGHCGAAPRAEAVVVRLEEHVARDEMRTHLVPRELARDGEARVEIGAAHDDRVT